MFEWRKRIEIVRAENALRDGRLDEAFSIASQKELREWRGCQVVLEKLVDPLLERAAGHLADGRLRDALLDVERAESAGGNRPRTAELRARVLEGMEARRREETRERDLVSSARRHLARGSVGAGKALLEDLSTMDPEVVKLKREAERREEKAQAACERADLLLTEGALLEALEAAREAKASCATQAALPPLLLKLKAAALPALEKALHEGQLAAARDLLSSVSTACGESLETRRSTEALLLAHEAAGRAERGRHADAAASLRRLLTLLPGAPWVKAAVEAVTRVEEGLEALRAGPLAALAGTDGGRAPSPNGSTHAAPPSPEIGRPAAPAGQAAGKRFVLWVDGVGSFLLLAGDRVSIGRAGSSARPDIALAADIGGLQAEVVRTDEDYFLVPQGPVEVNGKPVDRKLLADGDRIRFAPRCEATFRL